MSWMAAAAQTISKYEDEHGAVVYSKRKRKAK
jgi:hypothetical protein